ncbi:hypothetical protein ACU5EH_15930 [Aliivibrio salmonicida]|uniref:hypothetical protein n=1 Tax=Aliivibrio salmonicida TaxID=40269 RepID=UPI00406C89FB
MLKAIIHGKAGRIEHNENDSVSWSSLFKAREDLLTSTVFERFAYLSDAVQAHIIHHWFKECSGITIEILGEFISISYWPRFEHAHEQGINQVEPDLILHFTHCNILIEVKPPAGGDQYFKQWHKEIESFLQSDIEAEKPLYFLAIGRIEKCQAKIWANEILPKFDRLKGMAAIEWREIAELIMDLVYEDHLVGKTLLNKQERRVLDDILAGLSLYGLQVSPFKWTQFKPDIFPRLSLQHPLLQPVSKELK